MEWALAVGTLAWLHRLDFGLRSWTAENKTPPFSACVGLDEPLHLSLNPPEQMWVTTVILGKL